MSLDAVDRVEHDHARVERHGVVQELALLAVAPEDAQHRVPVLFSPPGSFSVHS